MRGALVELLKERILREGVNLGNGILKVDSFINHQVTPPHAGRAALWLPVYFANKIVTAEISGIAPALTTALALGIPVVYARKTKPVTMHPNAMRSSAPSHTKGIMTELMVSPEFLGPRDHARD
jgi:xanthine phosphoribosyltransferase